MSIACDAVSAKWAASRLGKKKEILFGGSTSQGESAWDDLYGDSRFNGSFSERWEDVLQPQEFMVGRTGGPANGFLVDGVVLKSGEAVRVEQKKLPQNDIQPKG